MKLLLCCTKGKTELLCNPDVDSKHPCRLLTKELKTFDKTIYYSLAGSGVNNKIVAECDFEVEEIYCDTTDNGVGKDYHYYLENGDVFYMESGMTDFDLLRYLGYKNGGEKVGYAIHITNIHIFETPKRTSAYNTYNIEGKVHIANIPIYTAPQNMMYAFDYYGNRFVLISIKPEDLCKILNGEKTIEVRKKVLKRMLKNE